MLTEAHGAHWDDRPFPAPRDSVPIDPETSAAAVVAGIDTEPVTSSAAVGLRERLVSVGRMPHLRLGLSGQVMTFAAMVVPIALREGRQVTALVFTSAIATAAVSTALLGYQFVYPVIRGPRTAAVATRLAFTALTISSLLLLPLTVLENRIDLPRGTFAATAVLLFTMGLYGITVTQLVRAGDTRGIGLVRFRYGAGMLLFTTLASVWTISPLGLTVATVLANLIPAGCHLLRRDRRAQPAPRLSRAGRSRLVRACLRRSMPPTLSTLANGWAFFLPGISLPGLGVAEQPWAIVARICGGFSTVLTTIISPPLEARMAWAVRMRQARVFARVRRSALLAGGAASVLAMTTGLALALYENWSTSARWTWPVVAATVLYWTVLLASAPINRTPNFVGRDGARLVWDGARAGLITVAFLATDGIARLMIMGVALTVFGVLLLPLSRYRTPVQS